MRLTQGHAGGRGNTPKPLPLVQCSGIGLEKGWNSALLHGFPQAQCMDQKGLIPTARSAGEYGGCRAFFNDGFQEWMAPKSQQYTTFTVGNLGFYKFTRMPLGLCNAPASFQCLMQNTLGEFNLTFCIIYLDDVIVFGRTEEEHLECLHVILEQFCKFNLKLKPSKCLFFQLEIVYLTHHVSHERICPIGDNVHAVEEFPMPETFTKSARSLDSQVITGILSGDLLTLLGHSTTYLEKKSRWAQYSCQLRHRKQ